MFQQLRIMIIEDGSSLPISVAIEMKKHGILAEIYKADQITLIATVRSLHPDAVIAFQTDTLNLYADMIKELADIPLILMENRHSGYQKALQNPDIEIVQESDELFQRLKLICKGDVAGMEAMGVDLDAVILRLLDGCCLSKRSDGERYLHAAIKEGYFHTESLLLSAKEMYQLLAERYKWNESTVSRSIRYILDHSWAQRTPESTMISELNFKSKPSSLSFIARSVSWLKLQEYLIRVEKIDQLTKAADESQEKNVIY